jgi:Protein of unknown function (DUF2892)
LALISRPIGSFFNFYKENGMKQNVGGIDRILRIVISVVLLALAYLGNLGAYTWVGYLLGAVMVGTAAIGWCPPYALFGWNTCSLKNKS